MQGSTPKKPDINKEIAKGSVWNVSFRLLEKFISIFSTIILARLLTPADFGIVALATMVIALLDLFRAFGVDNALIQNQQADKASFNTAWTFKVLMSLIIGFSLWIFAPFAADFFDDQRLTRALQVMSIGVLVSGFENIGIIAFRKDLKFSKDFNYMVARKIFNFISTISLAFYLKNYWALIIGSIATNIFTVIYSYHLHPYRPGFSFAKTRELASFSIWLFINNILLFLSQKLPQMIIGKLAGTSQLGLFTFSRDITFASTTAITLPINRAAFPGYAKLSDDPEALKQSFLNTLSMIALIIIPSGAGISAISSSFVPNVLGEKWLDTIPIMQVLAFAGVFFALSNSNAIYMSLGKPALLSKITLVRLVVYVPTMIIATYYYGPLGAAWSLLVTGIILLPFAYSPVAKILGISIANFWSIFARPTVASLILYCLVSLLLAIEPDSWQTSISILWLGLVVIIGALTYIMAVGFLWVLSGKPDAMEKAIYEVTKSRLAQYYCRLRNL